ITPTPCTGSSQMFMGSIAAGDPTQSGRVTRNGIVSTCLTAKSFPGYSNNSPWRYDAYTFTNNNPYTACMTVNVTNSCSNNILSTAYLNSFDPSNITTNYIADAGTSASNMEYAFNAPAGGTFVVVVHEVASGGCANYMLTVSGFACGPTATGTGT